MNVATPRQAKTGMLTFFIPVSSRARDGIRTRDPNLGKVVLHP